MTAETAEVGLQTAILEGDELSALRWAEQMLEAGTPAARVTALMGQAMAVVGERFQSYEFFLPDVVVAADAFTRVMERLAPLLRTEGAAQRSLGKVALGVVAGDIHDIGKDIVKIMLEAGGFDVEDLGSDVPVERFVAAAREADIIAMSSLMSTTMGVMGSVVEGLQEANLRERVRVLVGGAPVSRDFATAIGADGYGEDAVEAVRVATAWMSGGAR